MTRGAVDGLVSPHPLGEGLPAIYLEDVFVQRLTSALDLVLAPVFSSLDNLEWYLDPRLAPSDFVRWLGSWVGMVFDETVPLERQRELISCAAQLYSVRGTIRGLASHLRIASGAAIEIDDSGGTAWYTTSGNPPPGRPGFEMVVRLRVDGTTHVDLQEVGTLVSAAKPAHVVHRIELIGPESPPSAPPAVSPQAPAEPESTSQPDGTAHIEGAPVPAPVEATPGAGPTSSEAGITDESDTN